MTQAKAFLKEINQISMTILILQDMLVVRVILITSRTIIKGKGIFLIQMIGIDTIETMIKIEVVKSTSIDTIMYQIGILVLQEVLDIICKSNQIHQQFFNKYLMMN